MSLIRDAYQRDALLKYAGEEESAGQTVRAERTDGQLIELVLAGDQTAFELLFDRHKRLVARTGSRYFHHHDQIEEVIQISFTKAYFELAKFKGEHELSFPSWLGRITANTCLDLLRTRKRKPEDLQCDLSTADAACIFEFVDDARRDSEETLIDRDLAAKLLAKLPADDRALLHLYYVDEMSVAEVSEFFGWSNSKVKIRTWRARNLLRKLLRNYV